MEYIFLPLVRVTNCHFHLFQSSAPFFGSQYLLLFLKSSWCWGFLYPTPFIAVLCPLITIHLTTLIGISSRHSYASRSSFWDKRCWLRVNPKKLLQGWAKPWHINSDASGRRLKAAPAAAANKTATRLEEHRPTSANYETAVPAP